MVFVTISEAVRGRAVPYVYVSEAVQWAPHGAQRVARARVCVCVYMYMFMYMHMYMYMYMYVYIGIYIYTCMYTYI